MKKALLILSVSITFTSCEKSVVQVTNESIEEKTSELEQITIPLSEVDKHADVLAHFLNWDHITVSSPAIYSLFSKKTLGKFVQPLDKNIAVIYLDKRFDPHSSKYSNEEIAAEFHKMGFKRVVIKQSSGDSVELDKIILLDSIN